VSSNLAPVIAATSCWLLRSYPGPRDALAVRREIQARQATTIAAWLRYPTATDVALLRLLGPGGADRLDWIVGSPDPHSGTVEPWRTWVDEVVASWAACLLGDPDLAACAVAALPQTEHAEGLSFDFSGLLVLDDRDRLTLLRHPDLLRPVADLHRQLLLDRMP
jgi:hypothetical protein